MPSLDRLAPPERNGVVRVFVSSTFLDMQADRDELAKRVFPKLRNWCLDNLEGEGFRQAARFGRLRATG